MWLKNNHLKNQLQKPKELLSTTSQHHKASYKRLDKKELARRLNIHEKQVHPIKRKIIKDHPILEKRNFQNPDIYVDNKGNIIFKHPRTNETIPTNTPLTDYKN